MKIAILKLTNELRKEMRILYLLLMMSVLLSHVNLSLLIADEVEEVKHVTGNESLKLTDTEKQLLIERAMKNDPEASFRLARYYVFIKYDMDEAIKWYEKAAKAGHVSAQYNLASHLANPNVPGRKSRQDSMYWYLQATKQGNSGAMLGLAQSYETGNGDEEDLVSAFKWYEKAALEGEVGAILKMIEFYAEGKGQSQNNEKAYIWILIAKNKIHPKSVIGQRINEKKNKFLDKLSTTEVNNAENEFEILSKQIKLSFMGRKMETYNIEYKQKNLMNSKSDIDMFK